MKTILVVLWLSWFAMAQTAPAVTGIQARQQNGQTFITWNDASTGTDGANYRYFVYRSTTCPISSVSTAMLIEEGIYNNSGQLIGPKPFDQFTRQNIFNPMVTISSVGENLPLWSGLAVYTNLGGATACYAVITHDITGASTDSSIVVGSNSMSGTVAESAASILPILQIPGNDPSRMLGCSDCYVTSASIGQPLWLSLHPSGGSAPFWGDYWAYWGNPNMGIEDGTQSMFAVYQDVNGYLALSGMKNQLVVGPQDAIWSKGGGGNSFFANACSQTYWYGVMDSSDFPSAYQPPTNTGVHVFPYTQAKLALIVPWAIGHYQSDPNRIFGYGKSMGGYGTMQWSLQQPNLFAGVFAGDPVINSWGDIPQIDYGAAEGTVSVANNSTAVQWVSGPTFGEYLAGDGAGATPFNLTIDGQTKTVASVTNSTNLVLKNAYTKATGTQNYITGSGTTCAGIPAGQPCGAGLVTVTTTTDTLPNGITTYAGATDTSAWVAANCARTIPYVAWSAGRLDTTAAGMWAMSPALANALETCHYGFSLGWANDIHGVTTEAIVLPLSSQYAGQLRKNVSYPAFTGFSLDSNYGDGSTTNGDCITGNALTGPFCFVNYGWTWSAPNDTALSWSTTISNSEVTSGPCPTYLGVPLKCATTATVNVTPRNVQNFVLSPGASVQWTATGGQSGTVSADSYGLATIPVTVGLGQTTLTLQILQK